MSIQKMIVLLWLVFLSKIGYAQNCNDMLEAKKQKVERLAEFLLLSQKASSTKVELAFYNKYYEKQLVIYEQKFLISKEELNEDVQKKLKELLLLQNKNDQAVSESEQDLRESMNEQYQMETARLKRYDELMKIIKMNGFMDVNGVDSMGTFPLQVYASMGSEDVVQMLLDFGADIDRVDRHETTALDRAVSNLQIKTAQLLLKNGASINIVTKSNETVLMKAAWFGASEIIPELIARGVDVNAVETHLNNNALMVALSFGVQEGLAFDVVEQIILKTKNLNLRNKNNITALSLAERATFKNTADKEKVVELLKKMGAQN